MTVRKIFRMVLVRLAEISMLLSVACLGAIFFQENLTLIGWILFIVSLFLSVFFDYLIDTMVVEDEGEKNDI